VGHEGLVSALLVMCGIRSNRDARGHKRDMLHNALYEVDNQMSEVYGNAEVRELQKWHERFGLGRE